MALHTETHRQRDARCQLDEHLTNSCDALSRLHNLAAETFDRFLDLPLEVQQQIGSFTYVANAKIYTKFVWNDWIPRNNRPCPKIPRWRFSAKGGADTCLNGWTAYRIGTVDLFGPVFAFVAFRYYHYMQKIARQRRCGYMKLHRLPDPSYYYFDESVIAKYHEDALSSSMPTKLFFPILRELEVDAASFSLLFNEPGLVDLSSLSLEILHLHASRQDDILERLHYEDPVETSESMMESDLKMLRAVAKSTVTAEIRLYHDMFTEPTCLGLVVLRMLCDNGLRLPAGCAVWGPLRSALYESSIRHVPKISSCPRWRKNMYTIYDPAPDNTWETYRFLDLVEDGAGYEPVFWQKYLEYRREKDLDDRFHVDLSDLRNALPDL